MTQRNIEHSEAWRRATCLYHMGMVISAKAKTYKFLTKDQENVISIFLHEVKMLHTQARKEAGQ